MAFELKFTLMNWFGVQSGVKPLSQSSMFFDVNFGNSVLFILLLAKFATSQMELLL